MENIEVYFEDIDFDGAAIGYFRDKKIKAFGVLPEEKAIIKLIDRKRDYFLGLAIQINQPSNYRVKELEDHFISCSPWQIIEYDYQLKLKKKLLQKIWNSDIEIIPAKNIINYRTKMEFSFFIDQKISLAFFKRGTYKSKYKLPSGCVLASSNLNKFALKILDKLNENKNINSRILKGLTVRESKSYNQYLGVLFVKDKDFGFNIDIEENEGLSIYYSDPKSPAFVFTEKIGHFSIDMLREKVAHLDIFYGPQSFFQNNLELFNIVLQDIKENILRVSGGKLKIYELYAGVGVIGLFLSDFAKEVVLIELNSEACHFANLNANMNNIKNLKILNIPAEDSLKLLISDIDILILDPPRAGISPDVYKLINKTLPKVIVYLSCNPVSQFRDYQFLKDKYNLSFIRAYDFCPLTNHIESLIILEKAE